MIGCPPPPPHKVMRLNSRGHRGQAPDAVTVVCYEHGTCALSGIISTAPTANHYFAWSFLQSLTPGWDLFGDRNTKLLSFVFTGQLRYLQGLSLCGRCASSTGGQPDAENNKWSWGYSQGINMCHLDRRVNLSAPLQCVVPWAALPALISCCLSSECLSPGVSHTAGFSLAARGPRRGSRKCCFPLNSTLGHSVDRGRGPPGSGRLTGVPTVAAAW